MKYFVKIAAGEKLFGLFLRNGGKATSLSAKETIIMNRIAKREAAKQLAGKSRVVMDEAAHQATSNFITQSDKYLKGNKLTSWNTEGSVDIAKRNKNLKDLRDRSTLKDRTVDTSLKINKPGKLVGKVKDFKVNQETASGIGGGTGLKAPVEPEAPGLGRLIKRTGNKANETLGGLPVFQNVKNTAEYYSTAYKSLKNNPLAQDTVAIGIGAAKGVGRGAKAMHNFNMKALKTTAIAGGGLYAFNRLTD